MFCCGSVERPSLHLDLQPQLLSVVSDTLIGYLTGELWMAAICLFCLPLQIVSVVPRNSTLHLTLHLQLLSVVSHTLRGYLAGDLRITTDCLFCLQLQIVSVVLRR